MGRRIVSIVGVVNPEGREVEIRLQSPRVRPRGKRSPPDGYRRDPVCYGRSETVVFARGSPTCDSCPLLAWFLGPCGVRAFGFRCVGETDEKWEVSET